MRNPVTSAREESERRSDGDDQSRPTRHIIARSPCSRRNRPRAFPLPSSASALPIEERKIIRACSARAPLTCNNPKQCLISDKTDCAASFHTGIANLSIGRTCQARTTSARTLSWPSAIRWRWRNTSLIGRQGLQERGTRSLPVLCGRRMKRKAPPGLRRAGLPVFPLIGKSQWITRSEVRQARTATDPP